MDIIDFNPWWETGEVPRDFLPERRRFLFNVLKSSLEKRYIDVIVGLRRTGKTTLMYQLMDYLIKSGIDPRHILYFSFDERRRDLEDVIREYEEKILRAKIREKRVFIFLDEIHKLDHWADRVKIVYDLNPKAKIVASGSASLNLMKNARESLAGRCVFHRLDPLTFKEFLWLKREKIPGRDEIELSERKIRIEIFNFIERGFPEIINANRTEARRYVKELVIERILYRDIPENFKVRDIEILRVLMEYIFSNPGAVLNVDSLSKSFRRARKTVTNVLEYLELSFLIRRVSNLRGSFLAMSRKNRKGYPFHPTLAFTHDEGRLIECLVASEIDAKYYWRSGGNEVDFIMRDEMVLPIEVKYSEHINHRDLKGLFRFCKRYNVKQGIVVTKDQRGEINGMKLVPLHEFLLLKDELLPKLHMP